MSVQQRLAVLAVTASVCISPLGVLAQAPQSAASQLTDTPVAPPNTEAMRVAGIAKDNSRHFGSDPDDPGPLAKDLSPALKPDDIAKAMRKVADWQLAQSEQYFAAVQKPLLDGRIWTWSALYDGLVAASTSLGDPKYSESIYKMGKSYDWGLRSKSPGADDLSLSQAYFDLYLADKGPGAKDKSIIAPSLAEMDSILARPDTVGPEKKIEWWWCDAVFMAPPAWARAYAATGDKKYITYLDAQFAKTYKLLWDQEEHLYARDATFIPKREKNGKKVFWSRGEGWVMGGLARTLEYLPKDDAARAGYVKQLQDMAAAAAKLQGSDGLWHAGMLDPANYPVETSGSALMTFGMAWGINNGVLDRKTYEPVVAKAWAGLLQHVYADGRLGGIQQTGAEPTSFKPSASYTYGVGGFLLAGTELRKLNTPTKKSK